jgi:hypothetical protein
MFDNSVLRKNFGPKRKEIIQCRRKLHNQELHNLSSWLSIIRMINLQKLNWVGHVACMGEMTNPCQILVGKPQGKKPLGRLTIRWEDNMRP